MVLQPFVIPFLKKYPDIQLKLRAADGAIDIFSQGIDIVFHLTDKPDENLVLKEVGNTNLVLCASPPDYINTRGNQSTQTTFSNTTAYTLQKPKPITYGISLKMKSIYLFLFPVGMLLTMLRCD